MPSEEYKEENMRQVLAAALRCFEEDGVYATTLNKIANRAGVTIRSVSRYYGTKDNLISKALGYYQTVFLEGIYNFYMSSAYRKLSGYEQIKKMIEKRAQDVKDHPRLTLCVKEMEVYLIANNMGEELRIIYGDYFIFIKKIIVEALRKGLEDGSISKDVDVDNLEFFLFDVYRSFLKLQANAYCDSSQNSHDYADRSIEKFIRCLLDHMRA